MHKRQIYGIAGSMAIALTLIVLSVNQFLLVQAAPNILMIQSVSNTSNPSISVNQDTGIVYT
ncbi:MAG: hypothetical protein ACRD8Z_26015, partial [Nitrososphaeraceae archaeon]